MLDNEIIKNAKRRIHHALLEVYRGESPQINDEDELCYGLSSISLKPINAFLHTMQSVNTWSELQSLLGARDQALPLDKAYVELAVAPQLRPDSGQLEQSDHVVTHVIDIELHRKKHQETLFKQRMQVNDAIGQNIAQAIILGDPGSGKTSLLKAINLRVLSGVWHEWALPIFISLREYYQERNHNETLLDYAVRTRFHVDDVNAVKQFSACLKRLGQGFKHVIFLLDGLDEIASIPGARKALYKAIEQINTHFAWVMTSRHTGYQAHFNHVVTYEVLELSNRAINALVKAWFEHVQIPSRQNARVEEKARHLLVEISRNPRLQLMSRNPFLLSLLCHIKCELNQGEALPVYRSKIYELVFKKLRQHIQSSLDNRYIWGETVHREFRHFCYYLYTDAPNAPRQLFDLQLWQTFLVDHDLGSQEIKHALDKHIEPSRVLASLGENSDYHLIHLTLHEFLIASFLQYRQDAIQLIEPHLYKPHWRVIVRFLGGLWANNDEIIQQEKFQQLLKLYVDNVDLNGYIYIEIAWLLFEANIEDSTVLLGFDIREKLATLITGKNYTITEDAVDVLAVLSPSYTGKVMAEQEVGFIAEEGRVRLYQSKSNVELLELLDDQDDIIVNAAAQAVALRDDDQLYQTILGRIGEGDETRIQGVLEVAKYSGDDVFKAWLIKLLASDKNETYIDDMFDAIINMGDSGFYDPLMSYLNKEKELPEQIYDAIFSTNIKRARRWLKSELSDSGYENSALLCAAYKHHLLTENDVVRILQQASSEILSPFLDEMQNMSIDDVGNISEDVARVLGRFVFDPGDELEEGLDSYALEILKSYEVSRVQQCLEPLFEKRYLSDDPDVELISVLGAIGRPSYFEYLFPLLDNDEGDIAIAAMGALLFVQNAQQKIQISEKIQSLLLMWAEQSPRPLKYEQGLDILSQLDVAALSKFPNDASTLEIKSRTAAETGVLFYKDGYVDEQGNRHYHEKDILQDSNHYAIDPTLVHRANERIQSSNETTHLEPLLKTGRAHTIENMYVELALASDRVYQPDPYRLTAYKSMAQESIEKHQRQRARKVSIETILADAALRHILILGDPGSGKTSLLKHLNLLIAKGGMVGWQLPVFISLRQYWNTKRDNPQWSLFHHLGQVLAVDDIEQFVRDHLTAMKSQYMALGGDIYRQADVPERNNNVDKICFLLDGFDEISSDSQALKFILDDIRELGEFHHWVLTSRQTGIRGGLYEDARYEIISLHNEAITKLINNWFTYATTDDVYEKKEALLRHLEQHPALQELARNPFVLSLICYLQELESRPLPIQRSQIYTRIIDLVAKQLRYGREQYRPELLTSQQQNELADFSFYLYATVEQAPMQLFEFDDWQKFCQHFPFSSNQADITYFNQHFKDSRLLSTWNDIEKYHFVHLTFQEYFVAKAIAGKPLEELEPYLYKPHWRYVIRFLAGIYWASGNKKSYIDLLKHYDHNMDVFGRLYVELAWCLVEAGIEDSTPILDKDLRLDLWHMWKEGKPYLQEVAVDALAILSPDYLVKKVTEALDSDLPDTMTGTRTMAVLRGITLNPEEQKNQTIKTAAIKLLGKLPGGQGGDLLFSLLTSELAWLASAALEALIERNTPEIRLQITAKASDKQILHFAIKTKHEVFVPWILCRLTDVYSEQPEYLEYYKTLEVIASVDVESRLYEHIQQYQKNLVEIPSALFAAYAALNTPVVAQWMHEYFNGEITPALAHIEAGIRYAWLSAADIVELLNRVTAEEQRRLLLVLDELADQGRATDNLIYHELATLAFSGADNAEQAFIALTKCDIREAQEPKKYESPYINRYRDYVQKFEHDYFHDAVAALGYLQDHDSVPIFCELVLEPRLSEYRRVPIIDALGFFNGPESKKIISVLHQVIKQATRAKQAQSQILQQAKDDGDKPTAEIEQIIGAQQDIIAAAFDTVGKLDFTELETYTQHHDSVVADQITEARARICAEQSILFRSDGYIDVEGVQHRYIKQGLVAEGSLALLDVDSQARLEAEPQRHELAEVGCRLPPLNQEIILRDYIGELRLVISVLMLMGKVKWTEGEGIKDPRLSGKALCKNDNQRNTIKNFLWGSTTPRDNTLETFWDRVVEFKIQEVRDWAKSVCPEEYIDSLSSYPRHQIVYAGYAIWLTKQDSVKRIDEDDKVKKKLKPYFIERYGDHEIKE